MNGSLQELVYDILEENLQENMEQGNGAKESCLSLKLLFDNYEEFFAPLLPMDQSMKSLKQWVKDNVKIEITNQEAKEGLEEYTAIWKSVMK